MNKFEDIKDNLKSGDMILCSGNYPVSKIIREVTNSEYSHVGILYKEHLKTTNVFWIYESVETYGVRRDRFKQKYLRSYKHDGNGMNRYDGRIDIARHSEYSKLNCNDICRLFLKANESLGCFYNNEEIFDIAKRIMLNRHSGHPVDHGKYICSEYVYFCFKAAGIDLYYDDRGFISPNNILEDENVELIYRDVR